MRNGLDEIGRDGLVDGVLYFALAVGCIFLLCQWSVLEEDGASIALLVPFDRRLGARDEEAILTLVVILFSIRRREAKMHSEVAGVDAEGVVAELLGGLDVILVAIGPVKERFFAVVGQAVAGAAIARLDHEVAVGVVA